MVYNENSFGLIAHSFVFAIGMGRPLKEISKTARDYLLDERDDLKRQESECNSEIEFERAAFEGNRELREIQHKLREIQDEAYGDGYYDGKCRENPQASFAEYAIYRLIYVTLRTLFRREYAPSDKLANRKKDLESKITQLNHRIKDLDEEIAVHEYNSSASRYNLSFTATITGIALMIFNVLFVVFVLPLTAMTFYFRNKARILNQGNQFGLLAPLARTLT